MYATFEQLEKMVAPHLKSFRNDLVVHDRNDLEKHDCPFIYGYRDSGTNLLIMPASMNDWFPEMRHKPIFGQWQPIKDIEEARKILQEELIWIIHNDINHTFLYYDGKKLRRSTKQEVTDIWTNYVNNLTFKQ